MMSGPRLSATSLSRVLGSGSADGPAYRALAYRVRAAVLDGRLSPGSVLPSERELAQGFSLSRSTVAAAYSLLREDGWLDSRRGSGSTVRLPRQAAGTSQLVRPVPGTGGLLVGNEPLPDGIELAAAALPAGEGFLEAVHRAVAELPQYLRTDGYSPYGLPALREAIARKYTDQGVPTTPEQILVTNGAQQAFVLALGETTAPGDRVLVENPSYPYALDAIRSARRSLVPFGLNPRGGENAWDVELLEITLRQTAPRAAYLVPDFQNPTGALLSETDRGRLVRAARAAGTVLLIDETFRDLPFPGVASPPPVAASAADSAVLSLGSLSKSYWGGLRVGWIRASAGAVQRLVSARSRLDMAGPLLEQLISVELLTGPTEGLQAQRERLAVGATALQASLRELAPDWRFSIPSGGSNLWMELDGPYAAELARLAPAAGVRIAPGPRFAADGSLESFLRVPFTQPPELLHEAVRRLVELSPQAADARRGAFGGFVA